MFAAGYEPLHGSRADRFRSYGVPLYQRGALPIEGTKALFFAPTWAAKLIEEWPLRADDVDGDFDHYLLKIIIRRVARSGDYDFATAALSVAMLSGHEGIKSFLGDDIDWSLVPSGIG